MPQSAIRRYLKHGSLPQLSVFEAVVRLGSFTRAGEELCMAQPTVSVQMKKLSETIGLPLIEHTGKRIQLTDAGSILHAACLQIFATLAEAECGMVRLRALESRRLKSADSSSDTGPCSQVIRARKLEEIAVKVLQ